MHSRPHSLARVVLAALVCLGLAAGCAKSAPEQSPPVSQAPPPAAEAAKSPADAGHDDVPALEWDQERMTKLTGDLATAMLAVRNSFRNDPMMASPDPGLRLAGQQMMETLRDLDRHCRSLASQVKKGGTADETRGTARRIGMLLRDANQTGRSLMTNEINDARIKPAMELINEIAPYYGKGPLYDTESMTLIDGGPNPNRRREGE